MLIEASKGGHTGVVQLLLDYPKSMITQMTSMKVPNNGDLMHMQKPTHVLQDYGEMEELRTAQHDQSAQTPQQPLSAADVQKVIQAVTSEPPVSAADQSRSPACVSQVFASSDLPDLPEIECIASNQPMFPSQPPTSEGTLSLQNILLNANGKNASSVELQDSILANMRLMRNKGFKDGLALGLSRFGLNNNNLNASSVASLTQTSNALSAAMPAITAANNSPATYTATTTSTTTKQKSLLRKNRQPPAPFELNEMTRVHPFLIDLTKSFANENKQKAPTFGEEFKLVSFTSRPPRKLAGH